MSRRVRRPSRRTGSRNKRTNSFAVTLGVLTAVVSTGIGTLAALSGQRVSDVSEAYMHGGTEGGSMGGFDAGMMPTGGSPSGGGMTWPTMGMPTGDWSGGGGGASAYDMSSITDWSTVSEKTLQTTDWAAVDMGTIDPSTLDAGFFSTANFEGMTEDDWASFSWEDMTGDTWEDLAGDHTFWEQVHEGEVDIDWADALQGEHMDEDFWAKVNDGQYLVEADEINIHDIPLELVDIANLDTTGLTPNQFQTFMLMDEYADMVHEGGGWFDGGIHPDWEALAASYGVDPSAYAHSFEEFHAVDGGTIPQMAPNFDALGEPISAFDASTFDPAAYEQHFEVFERAFEMLLPIMTLSFSEQDRATIDAAMQQLLGTLAALENGQAVDVDATVAVLEEVAAQVGSGVDEHATTQIAEVTDAAVETLEQSFTDAQQYFDTTSYIHDLEDVEQKLDLVDASIDSHTVNHETLVLLEDAMGTLGELEGNFVEAMEVGLRQSTIPYSFYEGVKEDFTDLQEDIDATHTLIEG